jgi:transcriptional regulator with XRE-family HTH domain
MQEKPINRRPIREEKLMGKASRRKPERLGEKLAQIREALGLSQNEMIKYLGLTEELTRNNLAVYESGKREPSLLVLLRYARVVGIALEILVDDELDLPGILTALIKSEKSG